MKLKKVSVKNFYEIISDNEMKKITGGYDDVDVWKASCSAYCCNFDDEIMASVYISNGHCQDAVNACNRAGYYRVICFSNCNADL